MFQLYSELTITKQERHPWSYTGVFIINFEQISHIVLVFPLLTSNKQMLAGKTLSMNFVQEEFFAASKFLVFKIFYEPQKWFTLQQWSIK